MFLVKYDEPVNHVQQTRLITHTARHRTTERVSDYRDSTVNIYFCNYKKFRFFNNLIQFAFKNVYLLIITMSLHGKESTEVWITQNIGKEWGNSYRKMKRYLEERHTPKHTETYLKYFVNHRCLSQSEESKCM